MRGVRLDAPNKSPYIFSDLEVGLIVDGTKRFRPDGNGRYLHQGRLTSASSGQYRSRDSWHVETIAHFCGRSATSTEQNSTLIFASKSPYLQPPSHDSSRGGGWQSSHDRVPESNYYHCSWKTDLTSSASRKRGQEKQSSTGSRKITDGFTLRSC